MTSRSRRFRTAAAAAAATALATAAAAPASAATAGMPHAGVSSLLAGGGWVAAPRHLNRTAVTVVVPRLTCAAHTDRRFVQLGMFGSVHHPNGAKPWTVTVRVRCKDGHRHAQAGIFDGANYTGIGVHAGDRVRLSADSVSFFEVDDRTTGRGVGEGSSGPGGGGGDRHVLFGARVTGHLAGAITARFVRAQVHGEPLGNFEHHRRAERADGTVVARASDLGADEASFTVRLS